MALRSLMVFVVAMVASTTQAQSHGLIDFDSVFSQQAVGSIPIESASLQQMHPAAVSPDRNSESPTASPQPTGEIALASHGGHWCSCCNAERSWKCQLHGCYAGYDGPNKVYSGKGFYVQSANKKFRFNLGGYMQFRYVVNTVQDDGTGNVFTDNAFTMPRQRFWFQGNAYENVTYFMRFDAQGRATDVLGQQDVGVNGLTELDNFWVANQFTERVNVKAGIFASVFNREQATIPSDKLAFDNSPTSSLFDTAVFEGLQLKLDLTDWYQTYWVASNGQRAINLSFSDPANADASLTHHSDFLLAGDWADFIAFTSPCGSGFGAKVNGTIHWEEGRIAAGAVTDIFQMAGELALRGNGWMFWSTIHYWRTNWKSAYKVEDLGFVAMGSRYVNPHLEWYARYDSIMPDSNRATFDDDFRTVTTGFSYYPTPGYNSLKMGLELNYFLDPTTNTLVSPSNSLMLNSSPEGDQFALAAQLGWVF